MKPTQQEIIDLAYEDGGHTYPEWLRFVPIFALERLVHLALERFGAGGGEPVMVVEVEGGCWDTTDFVNFFGIPDGTYSLYTHPSPTDLQAAYERGLDDAARVAADDAHVVEGRGYYDQLGDAKLTAANIRNAIEALKGKQ